MCHPRLKSRSAPTSAALARSQPSVDLIERAALTGEEREKVAHGNADRLLHLA